MSSSAQGGSGGGEEKGKGQVFNKFMRRASKVLRRGSSSKVSSSSNVSNVPPEPTAPVPAVVSRYVGISNTIPYSSPTNLPRVARNLLPLKQQRH